MPDVRPQQSEEFTLGQPEGLESGVDVDKVRKNDGATPLNMTPRQGREGVTVKHLLKAEAHVDDKATTESGISTPIYMAAQNGDEEVVDQVLEAGAHVNMPLKNRRSTPLYIAALRGHEGVVEQLLKAEADVNQARACDETTPLYIAAQKGHEGVVEQLLKAKADVNKTATSDGATSLYIAAEQGHEGVVEQLLKAGADPNTERARGKYRSPLSIAALEGYSRVCSLLLESGANVDHANGNAGPALRAAVTHGHREVALVLVEHGASDDTLTPPMMNTLYKWMAEALKEKNLVIAEKNKEMEGMVLGIAEWCAQAASPSVAAEQQNYGRKSSAPAQPQPEEAGRKRKVPSIIERKERKKSLT